MALGRVQARRLLAEKAELAAENAKVELAKANDAVRRKLNLLEEQVDDLDRINKVTRT